jgi:hypothetical protein
MAAVVGIVILVMTPLFTVIAIGSVVNGQPGIAVRCLLAVGICATAGVVAGAALALIATPIVLFFHRARRRARTRIRTPQASKN